MPVTQPQSDPPAGPFAPGEPEVHQHSRHIAGCAVCELDMAYVRAVLSHRISRDQADRLWKAGDTAALRRAAGDRP